MNDDTLNLNGEGVSPDDVDLNFGTETLQFGEEGQQLSVDEIVIDETSPLDFLESTDEEIEVLDLGTAENVIMTDSLFFRSSVDVVVALELYTQLVGDALTLFKPPVLNESQMNMFVVGHSSFPYMPDNVFSVFHKILVDVSTLPEYSNLSMSEKVSKAVTLLYEATKWTPGIHASEFEANFNIWCSKFSALAGCIPATELEEVKKVLSQEELVTAYNFFRTNSQPFVLLTKFMSRRSAIRLTTQLDPRQFGALTQRYMQAQQLQVFTMADAYDCVSYFLYSPDCAKLVDIDPEDFPNFSMGEIYRRLFSYELFSGIFTPDISLSSAEPDFQLIFSALINGVQNGSVSCEIALIVASLMALVEGNSKGNVATLTFLFAMQVYLKAFLTDPILVRPMLYGHIRDHGTHMELRYVYDDEVCSIDSQTPLCRVVGDKMRTFCIPEIARDVENQFVICPPNELVNPLRGTQLGGRIKITGSIFFTFSPTISWMASNKVSCDIKTTEAEKNSLSLTRTSSDTLLQVLLSYDSKFVSTTDSAKPVVISYENAKYYGLQFPGKDSIDLLAVCNQYGEYIPLTFGTLVLDKTTEDVIISYTGSDGETTDIICPAGKYFEEYLETTADSVVADFTLTDFVQYAGNETVVPHMQYRRAVQKLCDLNALSYEEELEKVQEVISRDLYYVLGIYRIDELVMSTLLTSYDSIIEKSVSEKSPEGWLDGLNLKTLVEIANTRLGVKSPLRDVKEWSKQTSEIYKSIKDRLRLTVADVCAHLDALDFTVLALQTLSKNELKRTPCVEEYNAIHRIPEIGSRLCVLEDKMVALRVLVTIQEDVLALFAKKGFLSVAYQQPILENNVDAVNHVLLEKSKRKSDEFTLPLTKFVLELQDVSAVDVMLKYFVLEQNLYALLDALKTAGDKHQELYVQILGELGLDATFDISQMSAESFKFAYGNGAESRIFTEYYSEFLDIIKHGAVAEVTSRGIMQVVKAFDLFNFFYDILVEIPKESAQENFDFSCYQDDFIRHCGSVVISYCPLDGIAAGESEGGKDRDLLIADSAMDFVFPKSVSPLVSYGVRDLHTVTEEDNE